MAVAFALTAFASAIPLWIAFLDKSGTIRRDKNMLEHFEFLFPFLSFGVDLSQAGPDRHIPVVPAICRPYGIRGLVNPGRRRAVPAISDLRHFRNADNIGQRSACFCTAAPEAALGSVRSLSTRWMKMPIGSG